MESDTKGELKSERYYNSLAQFCGVVMNLPRPGVAIFENEELGYVYEKLLINLLREHYKYENQSDSANVKKVVNEIWDDPFRRRNYVEYVLSDILYYSNVPVISDQLEKLMVQYALNNDEIPLENMALGVQNKTRAILSLIEFDEELNSIKR